MAGGIGSRFWPASREALPKQFLDILGTGESLLQQTYKRFKKVVPEENIYIITNAMYSKLVEEQLKGIKPHQIIGEPARKNTAPCVAYFAYKILSLNKNANMIVAPSDHLIKDEKTFVKKAQKALDYTANNNSLLTLGMKPSRPDTGYGYIQYIQKKVKPDIYKVRTFTEKPTLAIAQQFLDSGDYLWNSGIFVWSVSSIVEALEKHMPNMAEFFRKGLGKYNTKVETAFINETYSLCKSTSIDYGLMEKADNVYVIPSDFGWSDLGTWTSLHEMFPKKDKNNNALSGKNIIVEKTKDAMIMAPNDKLVVVKGLEDYIIVNTDDVLLIYPKKDEQEIKNITTELKSKKLKRYL